MNDISGTVIGINGLYEFATFMLWTAMVVVNPIAYSNGRMTDAPFIVAIVLSAIAWLVALANAVVLLGVIGSFFSIFTGETAARKSSESGSIADGLYSVINLLFSAVLLIYLPISYNVNHNMSDWIFIVDIVLMSVMFLSSLVFVIYLVVYSTVAGVRGDEFSTNRHVNANGNKP